MLIIRNKNRAIAKIFTTYMTIKIPLPAILIYSVDYVDHTYFKANKEI